MSYMIDEQATKDDVFRPNTLQRQFLKQILAKKKISNLISHYPTSYSFWIGGFWFWSLQQPHNDI